MLSLISRSAAGRTVLARYATSFARSPSSRTATKPRFGGRGLYGQSPKAIRGFASAALSKKAAPAKKPVKATTKKPTKAATKPTKAKAKVKAKPKAKPKAKVKAKAKPRAKAKAKSAAKPKRVKRVISPEKRVILERQRLKKATLYDEPKQLPTSPWLAFLVQQTQGKAEGGVINKMPAISQAFKALSPQEIQRLGSTVEQNKLKNAAAYKAWVESHPPQEIYDANLARKLLKRKHDFPKGTLRLIRDERLPKRPANVFSLFTKARWASGDYSTTNESVRAIASKIANEWKGLSVAERQPYEDLAKSESERYEKAAGTVLHRRHKTASES